MVSDFKDASCFLQAASKTKRQNITRPKAGWKDNLDNASKEVKKSGMAETATGAVLGEEYYIMDGSFLISFCSYELLILWFLVLIMLIGGLVLGPFGALFGASLGEQIGAKNAIERMRKERMEELGVTPEMLQMAKEVGITLNRAVEGLKACEDSLETLQKLARRLEEDANNLYEKAKLEMEEGNEDKARSLLFDRDRLQKKLKQTLTNCIDERKRVSQMRNNVEMIENRALEIENLLNRSVGAKALSDTASSDFSLSTEDPLLQKFRDLER